MGARSYGKIGHRATSANIMVRHAKSILRYRRALDRQGGARGRHSLFPPLSRTLATGTTARPSSTSTTPKSSRYGQPRQTEVLHILVREPFELRQMVKPDNWQRPGVIQVLKMNQVLHIPTGLYVYQQMQSNFWRADNARLAKFSLTSNDSCGNTYKEARRGGEIFTLPMAHLLGWNG